MKFRWLVAVCFSVTAFAGPLDDARTFFENGNFGAGDRALFTWLRNRPNDERVKEAFHLLQKEHSLESRMWPNLFEKWGEEPNIRGDYSRFYGGIVKRTNGDLDGAIEDFTALFKKGVLVEPSRVQLVETYLAADLPEKADREIAIIQSTGPEDSVVAYLRGLKVRYWLRKGEPKLALDLFNEIEPEKSSDDDLLHASIAALHAGDEERLQVLRKRLEERGLEASLGELAFEEGLLLAAASDSAAFEKLAQFLRDFPDHPRAADAEIALAEQHLNQVPAQPQAARDRQASARKRALTLEQSERLDFSAIWTERIAGDLIAVTERASRFLSDWPQSERRPDVMMMLGRAYFEEGNYPEAIDQFEKLSALYGESELVEVALFFAAKAASLTLTFENHEKALTMWDTVAERGGPLAANARHEQGLLHLANSRLDAALVAFEDVLMGGYETTDELKIATLCDGGHALFLKALQSDRKKEGLFEAAIESFQAAEDYPGASKAWKYQAIVRTGKCLEALDKTEEALALYCSVVKDSFSIGPNPGATVPLAQFDWLYRAGFSAIEIMEKQENWKGAVELAELLTGTGGPRAIEASERANRIRLKQFVWEGDE